jgi:hypothetical protein
VTVQSAKKTRSKEKQKAKIKKQKYKNAENIRSLSSAPTTPAES